MMGWFWRYGCEGLGVLRGGGGVGSGEVFKIINSFSCTVPIWIMERWEVMGLVPVQLIAALYVRTAQ